MSVRERVLRVYRRILRLGRTWQAVDATRTADERRYIGEETRRMFRRHSAVTDTALVASYLHEAEARLEMALHYRNPFPRPVNLPPGALAQVPGRQTGSKQRRLKTSSRPVYMRSTDEETQGSG